MSQPRKRKQPTLEAMLADAQQGYQSATQQAQRFTEISRDYQGHARVLQAMITQRDQDEATPASS